eukprot:g49169.t1
MQLSSSQWSRQYFSSQRLHYWLQHWWRGTGSHNLVVGDTHVYSSHSGILSGLANTLSAPFAIAVGQKNTVSSEGAAVLGGSDNKISEKVKNSAVVGGSGNEIKYVFSPFVDSQTGNVILGDGNKIQVCVNSGIFAGLGNSEWETQGFEKGDCNSERNIERSQRRVCGSCGRTTKQSGRRRRRSCGRIPGENHSSYFIIFIFGKWQSLGTSSSQNLIHFSLLK